MCPDPASRKVFQEEVGTALAPSCMDLPTHPATDLSFIVTLSHFQTRVKCLLAMNALTVSSQSWEVLGDFFTLYATPHWPA